MKSNVSFSPGEILRDELEARGWSASEFAQVIGRPTQTVSEILNDKKEITTETALEIARAFGTSPELWLNLQTNYRLREARSSRSDKLTTVERRARLRSLVPVREVTRRGWLPDTGDLDSVESSVCELLAMPSIDGPPAISAAARRSGPNVRFSPEQQAWLGFVALSGKSQNVATFDRDALGSLGQRLARELSDPFAVSGVRSWLAECGVAIVYELPLRSSKMDGAVVWLEDGPPTIGISTRGNRFDGFLFTLLHEMAHIWHEHVVPGGVTLDDDHGQGRGTDAQEAEADSTAARWIFPSGFACDTSRVTTAVVLRLANQHGVHPSVVVGRLQRDGRLGWNQLRGQIPRIRELLPDLGGVGE